MQRPFELETSRWWTAPRNALIAALVIGLYVGAIRYFVPAQYCWKPGERTWVDTPHRDPTPEESCWIGVMLQGIELEDDPDDRFSALDDFIEDLSRMEVTLDKHPKLVEAYWQVVSPE